MKAPDCRKSIWSLAQMILLDVLLAACGGGGSSGNGMQVSLDLSIAPTSLNLGSVTVSATSAAQKVTLTNSSAGSITVNTINISGPFAFAGATLPMTVNAGHSLNLNVTFTPTASGTATGMLTVASTAGNSPASVTLAGTGIPPLSPSGPIAMNGQNGTMIDGLKITSTTGDCVQIINSSNITIQNSEIGPCAGNGVKISGGDGISIFDTYIHPETLSPGCCDNNDGIFAVGTSNLLIQGNVIAYGESNIEVQGGSTVTVIGNFLLNPRGPETARGNNFQCWSQSSTSPGCSNVTVQNNYALSSLDTTRYLYPEATEDSISFGFTDGAIAQNNYITGGHGAFGCGLIADKGANSAQFLGNRLVDAGQCGIGIADGTNQLVDGNKVINRNPVAGSGNQGIYVWQFYGSNGICGPATVSNNISVEYKPDGSLSGFWKGPGCDPLTLTNNVFGQPAVPLLTPVTQVLPPPLIPPQPKACVVLSPYSTQSDSPLCVP
jgi:hypothetical protein